MRNAVAAVAAIATIATASLAFAQANSNKNAPSLYGVYDSKGAFVGTLNASGIFRVFDRTPYSLEVTPFAVSPYVGIFFQSTDCTGQAFFSGGPFLPLTAVFVKTTGVVWGLQPVQPVQINAGSFYSNDQGCNLANFGSFGATPMVIVDTTIARSWVPPFSVR